MKRNEKILLLILKFRWKSRIFLLFFRFFQRFSLKLWKKRSKSFLSLLSLFFLSWEWKFFLRNKTFQRFDNFVKISLICVKVRRFRLFNSSMNSAISFVEKYDFVNTVTIIVNRFSVSLSVSVFVSFRFFAKKKERNFAFDFVKSSISKFYDVFSSIFLSVAFFFRFFVSFFENYRDSFFVFRFRFFSKVFQKRFYVSFHFSINLKKKKCEIFFEFLKNSDSTAKIAEIFSTLTWIK